MASLSSTFVGDLELRLTAAAPPAALLTPAPLASAAAEVTQAPGEAADGRYIVFGPPETFAAGQCAVRIGTAGLLAPGHAWGTVLEASREKGAQVALQKDAWHNLIGVLSVTHKFCSDEDARLNVVEP